MNHILLVVMWFVYFLLHSGLASSRIKGKFHKQKYRLFYSVIALLGLLPILFHMIKHPGVLLFPKSTTTQFVGLMFATYGFLLIRKAFKSYHTAAFLGLSNAPESNGLQINGIFEKIRHPIYAGTILMTIGFIIFIGKASAAITGVCIMVYIPLGIWLEEKKLIVEYGKAYLDYRKSVPALIPKLKR